MISEIENYLQRMDDLRGQVESLTAKVKAEDLNWQPFPAGGEQISNSVAILVAHICGAEHFWIGEVIGGKPSTRDRKAEFGTTTTSHSELFHLLHQNSIETREVLLALTTTELEGSRLVESRNVPVRWAILHVIDHTALHLGHLQMTYQLLTGGLPNASPLWTQRIP